MHLPGQKKRNESENSPLPVYRGLINRWRSLYEDQPSTRHVWNDGLGTYVLKEGAAVPEGVKTRAQIVAERNKFLASYRWNDGKSAWEPIAGKPRDVAAEPLDCGKTRAEIQKDCTAFLKTHRWDEASGTYVAIKK
ncbi:MAG: hypothetical protein H6R03_1511 [Burkholderiaceae bacterium]|nr:hypothetical protein [Burkholderiaceae bacterium]